MALKVLGERVRALLDMLPDDPDQIAERLRGKGIRGRPLNGSECPIACYLRATMDPGEFDKLNLKVGTTEVVITGPTVTFDNRLVASLRPTERSFIFRFDAHHYPDLHGPPTPEPA